MSKKAKSSTHLASLSRSGAGRFIAQGVLAAVFIGSLLGFEGLLSGRRIAIAVIVIGLLSVAPLWIIHMWVVEETHRENGTEPKRGALAKVTAKIFNDA